MTFFNQALLSVSLAILVAGAIPACGSSKVGGPTPGGSSGSASGGQAGSGEDTAEAGNGGSGAGKASSGGSSGAASSGTSSGGAAGADGGASASEGGNSSGVTALTDAYCAALRSCCQKGGFGSEQLGACESEYPEIYGLNLVEAGTVVIDQAALDTCLDTLQQLATSCVGLPYSTCRKALKGTRATGAGCTDLSECMTGTDPVACIILGSDTSGQCQPIPRGTLGSTCFSDCFEGGSCSFTSLGGADPIPAALCYSEDDLFCDTALDVPKCASTHAMGAECDSDWQCGADGYCDYQVDPMICKPRKPAGEPCLYSSECSKRDELYCDGSACTQQPFVSESGCDGTFF
jgi:hypothetical protein